jgi:hypothetical protein
MTKSFSVMYCNNAECLSACLQYAEDMKREFVTPVIKNIVVNEYGIKIKFFNSAHIEETDIVDERLTGFRDGWIRRLKTESA